MKNKQTYYLRGSFALLLFVILGYTVKFAPQGLTAFDSQLQAAFRGDLPAGITAFFTTITKAANTSIILIWVGALALYLFFIKKWKAESALLLGSLVTSGLLVSLLKPIYARPRPSITHLVHETGYSFPSGHSLGITMACGALFIIVTQGVKNQSSRLVLQILLGLFILIILLSRVYVGVHYPSDVTAGFLLGFAVLNYVFPIYDAWRFRLRFAGKSK